MVCVICVLCLIVVSLPPGKNPFSVKINKIRSYPPYLEAVSSIPNLRTRHVVVISDPPNMAIRPYKLNSVAVGRKRTIPTERPPLVGLYA
jgi:hypothetical protein